MPSGSNPVALLDDFRVGRAAAPSAQTNPIADVDVEQALIGTILGHPEVYPRVEALVAVEHFYEQPHKIVWAAIADVVAAGDTPNLMRVRAAIGAEVWGQDFGGKTFGSYLTGLAIDGLPAQAVEYARIVQQIWQLRELHAATGSVTPGTGFVPGPALDRIYARIDAIRSAFVDRKVTSVSLDEASHALVTDIQASLQGEDRPPPSCGIAALDEEIGGGLLPSFLLTIGARTSVGKSVVGVEMGRCVASGGHAAIYHSLEMSRKQIAARIAASHLFDLGVEISFSQIQKRRALNDRDAYQVAMAARDTRDLPFHIEDGGGRTIGDIAASTDRLANFYARRNIPLGLVVIDHAHIVKFSRNFNREDEGFKEVADGALALAKHLDTTVLLLAQLNRGPETREDKRPGLADLRGAGAFEEDSDAVIFLYRPAYYIERSPAFRNGEAKAIEDHRANRHGLEFIIDKNRAGRSNHIVRAWIDPALNAVRDLHFRG
ncbi:replicative DNA helicase [Methylobacterium komagatae]|uniref:DNA 5'-3' helicase n=1 Tax=Methylobacterium komagatae TaxID=374425 RepID=A0ABW2BQF1_9HYPH